MKKQVTINGINFTGEFHHDHMISPFFDFRANGEKHVSVVDHALMVNRSLLNGYTPLPSCVEVASHENSLFLKDTGISYCETEQDQALLGIVYEKLQRELGLEWTE